MRYSRPVRILLGILILALFAAYTYLRVHDCVMSDDVPQKKPNPRRNRRRS